MSKYSLFDITWSADHAAEVTVIASSKVNTISNVSVRAYSPATKSADKIFATPKVVDRPLTAASNST